MHCRSPVGLRPADGKGAAGGAGQVDAAVAGDDVGSLVSFLHEGSCCGIWKPGASSGSGAEWCSKWVSGVASDRMQGAGGGNGWCVNVGRREKNEI